MNEKEASGKPRDPADDAIGRPGDWSEGRYEPPGDEKQPSVVRKPGEDLTADEPASTPVTQKDYRDADPKTGDKPEVP